MGVGLETIAVLTFAVLGLTPLWGTSWLGKGQAAIGSNIENSGPTFSPTSTPGITPTGYPTPAIQFRPDVFFQDESNSASIILSRVITFYIGPLSATFSTSDGTATGGSSCTPGIDYVQIISQPVVLEHGQYATSVQVPICSDNVSEHPETIDLLLTDQITGPKTASLTISDHPLRFSISGRVLTSDGRGIRNATVVLPSSEGPHRYASTGSFGWYIFEEVIPGQSYYLNVTAPRYTFAASHQDIPLLVGDVTDLNFIADPHNTRVKE